MPRTTSASRRTSPTALLLPIAESPGSLSEGVFTWSLSPQFQLSEDTLLYGRVATGYQPGGPNVAVAAACRRRWIRRC
jgi:outer membrane receptor protein involved in Fe transport